MISDRKNYDIEVYALGQFRILVNGIQMSSEKLKNNKKWDLFKFLISFRNRNVDKALIYDSLWDEEVVDPEHALRTLVYRLRKDLEDEFGPLGNPPIIRKDGFYAINDLADIYFDFEEFSDLCLKGRELSKKNTDEAEFAYGRAIEIYKGPYLGDIGYNWVHSLREHYRTLYLNAVMELSLHYKMHGKYQQIYKSITTALIFEPFYEKLHIFYIEMMIENGELTNADAYIEKMGKLFADKASVKTLKVLREKVRVSLGKFSNNKVDMVKTVKEFEENEMKGALVCTPEQIEFLYRLESRRKGRHSYTNALISLHFNFNNDSQEYVMKKLFDVLAFALRKGDALCRWNENQFLVILFNVDYDCSKKIIARIRDGYNKVRDPDDPLLNSNIIEVV